MISSVQSFLKHGSVFLLLCSTSVALAGGRRSIEFKVSDECSRALTKQSEKTISASAFFDLALLHARETGGMPTPEFLAHMTETERFEFARITLPEAIEIGGSYIREGLVSTYNLSIEHEVEIAMMFPKIPLDEFKFGEEKYFEVLKKRAEKSGYYGLRGDRSVIRNLPEDQRFELYLVIAEIDPFEAAANNGAMATFQITDKKKLDRVVIKIVEGMRQRVDLEGITHEDNQSNLRNAHFYYDNLGDVIRTIALVQKNFPISDEDFQKILKQAIEIDPVGFVLLFRIATGKDGYKLPYQNINKVVSELSDRTAETDKTMMLKLSHKLQDMALLQEFTPDQYDHFVNTLSLESSPNISHEQMQNALSQVQELESQEIRTQMGRLLNGPAQGRKAISEAIRLLSSTGQIENEATKSTSLLVDAADECKNSSNGCCGGKCH